jgi:hypothetical protein
MTAPVSILRGVPIRQIAALFASLPRLTPEEADSFARDYPPVRPKARDGLKDPRKSCLEIATNPNG